MRRGRLAAHGRISDGTALLPEYDFSAGVRGKYAARVAKGSNIVVLDKDVQRLFPDSAATPRCARWAKWSR